MSYMPKQSVASGEKSFKHGKPFKFDSIQSVIDKPGMVQEQYSLYYFFAQFNQC